MKIKSKKGSKYLLFLVINLIIGILIVNSNWLIAHADENTDEFYIYNKYTPDVTDDFEENKIIVTLTKDYSDVNKPINYSDFESDRIITMQTINSLNLSVESQQDKIVIKNIYDLTYVSNPNIILEPEEFRQIFAIELMDNNKENVLEVIEEFEECNFIIAAEPLYNFSINSVEENPYLNDSEYDEQWGLHGENGIQAEEAWTLVGNGKVTPTIRVGIFETNMQMNHPDLDTITGSFTPATNASSIHGTHVAGIIGAISDNEIGIAGVAQVQIGLLDRGPAEELERTEFIDSLVWAIENNVRIANASFGFSYNGSDAPAQASHIAAIQNFGNQGGILICAAGNKANNNDNFAPFPAGYADSTKYPQITNVISVGAINENGQRRAQSNFGVNSVHLFAPGGDIYSTLPGSSYGYYSGTSMAAPHVTGVAALLLSINQNLTVGQIREAILNSVTIPNIGGSNPLEDLCVTDGRLNAYNAVKYVLEHFSNTEYTLSNYSSTINTDKVITSDASYFDELNGFYKLNVTYAKNYEFISSSTSGIEVTLYDEDFTEIPFNDLDSTSNKVHFIESLNTGTYYLRTKYVNEENTGTINTQIVSRTTAYIGVGDNDVLLNTYNYNEGIYPTNYYYYINSTGVGLYRFTLTGVKVDGTEVTYPYSSIMIKDQMNEDIIDKYSLTGYSTQAISGQNKNTFVAYLNATGYFYVYIDIDTEGLKSLTLNIEPVESETIDLFTKSESTNSTMEILDSETTKGDYAKKIILKQAGEFTVNYSYSGSQSSDILFVLGKLNYNSTTQKYTIETLISQLMDAENDSFTYTLDLTDGTYFVAYFDKDDNAAFDVTFNRLVTQYGGSVLIPDPDSVTDGGSQVEVYEKGLPYYEVSYRGTNIVIGFTRVIYIDYHYVNQNSREDYYWYSSNDSIATVSQHGTVFGKSAGTVKIMAVNKDDPSIVFVKQFTVVQDTKTYSEVIYSEFNDTHKLSNSEYQLGLDVQNSPYPMAQYYSWRVVSKSSTITSVSIDQWGNVAIVGTGNIVIEGYNYIYNDNYGVRINLIVTN